MLNFVVKFENLNKPIKADFAMQRTVFQTDFESASKIVIVDTTEHYKGNYEVTPKTIQQVMQTRNLIMDNDVIINKIPYFETGNNFGGNTVYIGSEV